VVDDGIATGNTLLSTIAMLRRQHPAKIIIAAPVASASSIDKLSPLVDEIVCPWVPDWFGSVGAFYEHFGQVEDDEVLDFMNKIREETNIK
jgi:predicted phosphoribosyltransferase